MEPDILAAPSPSPPAPDWNSTESSTPSRPSRDGAVGSAHPKAHDDAGASIALEAIPLAPPQTDGRHAPGTNGHHANGHGNGNGNGHHANGAYASLTANAVLLGAARAPAGVAGPALADVPSVLEASAEDGFYLRFFKRVTDVVGATFALVLSLPMLVIAAIAIKLESPGPVFYRSTRIGRGGRSFTFFKLRSMVQDADRHRHRLTHLNECDGPVFKITNDPRVTGVGRFLRTTSIDEIPQFLNVLRGDMSLVGPRPPIPEEVAQYEPWQLRRLDVRPGITCLWQISGRSRIGFREWMRLDLEYINRRSFRLDLMILVRTIPAVLSREGAY